MQRGIVDADDGDLATTGWNEGGLIDQESNLVAIGELGILIDRYPTVVIMVAQGDEDRIAEDVDRAIMGSLAYCRAHLDEISDYAARWEPFSPEQFRGYFDALAFRFEPRYREGLKRYFAEAVSVGQLERVPEIEVFGE